MYYLFIRKKENLKAYKKRLETVKRNIANGTTPVFNEMSSARTALFESAPYNIIKGTFTIGAVFLIDHIALNEMLKIAIVLIINNMCGALATYVFTVVKHYLRIRLCKRLKIEANEKNIAAMESLEYQSV
jgi:hypothetical protein